MPHLCFLDNGFRWNNYVFSNIIPEIINIFYIKSFFSNRLKEKVMLSFISLAAATATNTKSLTLLERMAPPEDISENGHLIDWLFNYITGMNTFFFVLVCLGLFGFSYLYSSSRHKKPYYTYGNKKAHVLVVTLIGAGVFFGIDFNITRIANNDFTKVFVNFPKGSDVVKVQVMGQQWMWKMRYPGKDGVFNTADDVITNNDLRLPIGKKVVLQLISKDVIHSFYLPNVRRKVDAMPGRISRMWFKLNKTGVYDIACAEMCGTHHYLMKAKMTVYSQEEYNNWLEEAQTISLARNDVEDPNTFWGWPWRE